MERIELNYLHFLIALVYMVIVLVASLFDRVKINLEGKLDSHGVGNAQ